MLWRRLLGSSAPPPPLWVTTSPLLEAEWEDPYLQALLATSGSSPVGYSVASGALPPGLALVADQITGTLTPNPDAPVWTTAAGSLGTGTQGAVFSADLDAPGASSFTIRHGLFPWGLLLDTTSGAITGTLATSGGAEDSPGPAPTWTTAAGSLGTFSEQAAVSVSIAATPSTAPVEYSIASGGVPWGLTLNVATGILSGTTAEVGGGVTPEPPNTITWSAPASTNLGGFAVGASVSVAQTVSFSSAFMLSSGVLPWGLSLARGTGLISGTVGAANSPGTYNFTVFAFNQGDGSFGYRTYTITIT